LGIYLEVVGNNRSGSLPARDCGVGKRKNTADSEQKDEQQVGTEVKRGTAQPELETGSSSIHMTIHDSGKK
jgi:hypothetical protein